MITKIYIAVSNHPNMEHIKNTIQSFIKGGDNTDINLLEKVIHPNFQNIQDGFFTEKGIYIFNKEEYIELVRNKTFGGKPRTIVYDTVEQMGNIAIAKVVLESEYVIFNSTIICVCDGENWQVINNTPSVVLKATKMG